jgi:hypothetical protein
LPPGFACAVLRRGSFSPWAIVSVRSVMLT